MQGQLFTRYALLLLLVVMLLTASIAVAGILDYDRWWEHITSDNFYTAVVKHGGDSYWDARSEVWTMTFNNKNTNTSDGDSTIRHEQSIIKIQGKLTANVLYHSAYFYLPKTNLTSGPKVDLSLLQCTGKGSDDAKAMDASICNESRALKTWAVEPDRDNDPLDLSDLVLGHDRSPDTGRLVVYTFTFNNTGFDYVKFRTTPNIVVFREPRRYSPPTVVWRNPLPKDI
ncbi:hypothetical protein GQ54DRAFT_201631 [Martensiomyces pterosporus]|nr:hypothetical protein GQ54DRAFT_201631 [Martensiomyces pterosporus]